MTLSDKLKNILDRIEARSYTEADLTTLRQLLSNPSNLVIDQLKSEYNINIEQARDFHIGDIYITSDTEVIQSVTQDDQERLDRLKKLQEKSRASCIARFRIAVASRERAIVLADDQSLGIPPKSLNLEPGNVSVLIGELGIGKTLIAQRLFQQAVARAIDESDAPIPIYLESGEWQKDSSLEKIVNTAAAGLGRLEIQGATIFLDGLDEIGTTVATQVLKEAYELVEIWPNTTLLTTSRPIRCLDDLVKKEEKIRVPPLSEQQVHELIEKVLGQKITVLPASKWTDSIKDAIRRPLFALVLARYLQQDPNTQTPRSVGELLSWLVNDALRQAKVDYLTYVSLLKRLATLCIESSNGWTQAANIAPTEDTWEPLLEVGIVVTKARGVLSFPLPILMEWFAAQGLADTPSIIKDCVQEPRRLENWRYPLTIAVATFSHDLVSELLTPIAETYPTFAAEIILAGSSRSRSKENSLPPQKQCRQQIRQAMQSWVNGLGPLAEIIAPTQQNKILQPVGTRPHGKLLEVAWYAGPECLSSIVDLPSNWSSTEQRLQRIWTHGKTASISNEASWAWRWTLNTLVSQLQHKIKYSFLKIECESFVRETSWRAALAIIAHERTFSFKQQKWWGPEKISLDELEQPLTDIENQSAQNCYIVLSEIGARSEDQQIYYLKQLRQEINRLRGSNQTDIYSPYVGPDLTQGKYLWELYSLQRLQMRIQEVYEAALNIYQQIIETWFPSLKPGLKIAAMLPARLVGHLSPKPGDNSSRLKAAPPQFHYFLESLPKEENNTVEIFINEDDVTKAHSQRIVTAEQRLYSLRPESAVWMNHIVGDRGLSRKYFFDHSPAIVLAYSWLEQDLRRVFGIFSFISSPYGY